MYLGKSAHFLISMPEEVAEWTKADDIKIVKVHLKFQTAGSENKKDMAKVEEGMCWWSSHVDMQEMLCLESCHDVKVHHFSYITGFNLNLILHNVSPGESFL